MNISFKQSPHIPPVTLSLSGRKALAASSFLHLAQVRFITAPLSFSALEIVFLFF
jgi:hypothetical protein